MVRNWDLFSAQENNSNALALTILEIFPQAESAFDRLLTFSDAICIGDKCYVLTMSGPHPLQSLALVAHKNKPSNLEGVLIDSDRSEILCSLCLYWAPTDTILEVSQAIQIGMVVPGMSLCILVELQSWICTHQQRFVCPDWPSFLHSYMWLSVDCSDDMDFDDRFRILNELHDTVRAGVSKQHGVIA